MTPKPVIIHDRHPSRPSRNDLRDTPKSDAADAVAAALAALSGEASGVPKSRDGLVESILALRVARAGAVKARTQAGNQLRDLILTAPEQVRRQLAGLPGQRQVDVAARFRPHDLTGPAEGTEAAMASLARRHQELAAEIARLDAALEELLTRAAPPELLAKQGVATVVAAALLATVGDNPGRVRREASFAALCGASPVDASSGKQLRHRLNRGGDRQAKSALWTIAMTRLAHDPRTKAYAARRRPSVQLHAGEPERAVVVGQVTGQLLPGAGGSPGTLELASQRGSRVLVGWVGDHCPAGPGAGVAGDDAAVRADPDAVQVRGHVDEAADRVRAGGVVAGVDADVVVPAQPDAVLHPRCSGTGPDADHRRTASAAGP
jgi:transposase